MAVSQESTGAKTLMVRQVKSAIGANANQQGCLRSLGLGRPGKTALKSDRPEIRGMVATVSHLITVEEVD